MRPIDHRQPGSDRLGSHKSQIAISAHQLAPPQRNVHQMQHLPRIDRPCPTAHPQRTDPIPRQSLRRMGQVFGARHPRTHQPAPWSTEACFRFRPPGPNPQAPHHNPIRPFSAPTTISSTQLLLSSPLIANRPPVPDSAPAAHRRRAHLIPPDPPRSARAHQPDPEHDHKSDRRFRAPGPIDSTQRLIYQALTSEISAHHLSAPPAHRIDPILVLNRPSHLGLFAETLP